ncbi:MAG: methylated-DNA--[protein]-cysteine S-methyltransferase [Kofleriaceae bacterium]
MLTLMMFDSPIGPLQLYARGDALAGLYLPNRGPDLGVPQGSSPVLVRAATQLAEYFSGNRATFDLPLDGEGTEFQRKVWQALLDIPFGEVRSYAQIANAIGQPTASRAVGAANGKNPISIIVPCHRVIGSSGQLVGYGGGKPTKQWLLEHEQNHSGRGQRAFALG